MNHKKELAKRDRMAAELGEGGYVHRETKRFAAVRVSFYPKVSLHIHEWIDGGWGEWRRITKEQLEAEYDKLRL